MHRIKTISLLAILLTACFCLSACSVGDEDISPEQWGYECRVTYDSLGGIINAREVRETFYMAESLLYEPAGSANMLVEPAKEGCILAGWYTAKTDVIDENGNIVGYDFSADDRWDFANDRVTEDMTLYARWIPYGVAEYIDAQSGEILFSKNITTESPVQPLSNGVLIMVTPLGAAFENYYTDANCASEYDFSSYTSQELFPNDEMISQMLLAEFPQSLQLLDKDAVDAYENAADFLLLLNMGGALVSTDAETYSTIKHRRNEIIEEYIDAYAVSTASQEIYLKFNLG